MASGLNRLAMSSALLQTAARTLARWIEHNRRFTPRTQQHYKSVIWRFADYMPTNPADLTMEHIEVYLSSILKHRKARTANSHLTVIKSYCRWLSEVYGIPNPAAKIKMLKEDPPKQRVLSQAEYEDILKACTPIEADIIRFLANTGLRASEFQSLTWDNISDDCQWLRIVGKGRKLRCVPLNLVCRSIIAKSERKPNTPIHLLKSYTYRRKNGLYALCKSLSKRANVERFGPHSLRHFFATELMKKNVSIYKISKLLGHSSVRTTQQIYVHFEFQDLAGVTEALI